MLRAGKKNSPSTGKCCLEPRRPQRVCASAGRTAQVGRGREWSGELVWGRVEKGLVQQVKDSGLQRTAGGDKHLEQGIGII